MNNRVKANSCPPSGYSFLWLLYFLFTIGLMGVGFGYATTAPLMVIGRLIPVCRRAGDKVLNSGMRLLMLIQPWYKIHLRWTLPDQKKESAGSERRGLLLVSNHRSHLDSFILLSRVCGVRFLAKKSLFFIPFLGMMMRLSRHIPVERGRIDSFWKAMGKIRDALKNGEVVHVFPEMKRCTLGHQGTLSFLSAPFLVAQQENAWVVPIVFKGTDGAWPKGRFGIKYGHPIEVLTLEPLDSRSFASAEQLSIEVRRLIDQELLK
jgi:1-acyl-sn-glycerol-3-phosphate acyltransferase